MARTINRTIRLPSQNAAKQNAAKVSAAIAAPDPKRIAAFKHGISAESKAAMLLIAKGYRILARRFRSPAGEIDIVARRRGTLVFVEVKARVSYDDAVEAVTEKQRRRILGAAQLWLASRPQDGQGDVRFDVIIVTPGKIPQHIPAAFDAGY
jgi:putative endonuclease